LTGKDKGGFSLDIDFDDSDDDLDVSVGASDPLGVRFRGIGPPPSTPAGLSLTQGPRYRYDGPLPPAPDKKRRYRLKPETDVRSTLEAPIPVEEPDPDLLDSPEFSGLAALGFQRREWEPENDGGDRDYFDFGDLEFGDRSAAPPATRYPAESEMLAGLFDIDVDETPIAQTAVVDEPMELRADTAVLTEDESHDLGDILLQVPPWSSATGDSEDNGFGPAESIAEALAAEASLGDLRARPHLRIQPHELGSLSLGTQGAKVLMRMDGRRTFEALLALSPMERSETVGLFARLISGGFIIVVDADN
jgi:hypothetical protein